MNGLEAIKSPTETLQEGTIYELGIQLGVTASASGLLSQPSELWGLLPKGPISHCGTADSSSSGPDPFSSHFPSANKDMILALQKINPHT